MFQNWILVMVAKLCKFTTNNWVVHIKQMDFKVCKGEQGDWAAAKEDTTTVEGKTRNGVPVSSKLDILTRVAVAGGYYLI